MKKKSWHIDRRTFIRGMGVTCMLPFFEGMAMTSLSKFAKPVSPKRLCILYFPNGVGLPPKESIYHKRQNEDISSHLFNNGLCLPSGSNLSSKDQEKIISIIVSTIK